MPNTPQLYQVSTCMLHHHYLPLCTLHFSADGPLSLPLLSTTHSKYSCPMTPSLGTSEWTKTSASESTAETKLQVSLTPQSHSYRYQWPSSLCYSSSLSPFFLPLSLLPPSLSSFPSLPSSSLSPFFLPPSLLSLLPPSLPSSLLPLSVAGIAVIEHLEFNVVPLAVSLTSKFYQTMQDFFFPKAEGEGQGEGTDPDHAHLFGPGGVQRMCV